MRCRSRRPAPLEALQVIVKRSGRKFVAGPGASFDYLLNSLRRYLQVLHRGFLYALRVQRLRRCTLIPIRGTRSLAVGEACGSAPRPKFYPDPERVEYSTPSGSEHDFRRFLSVGF